MGTNVIVTRKDVEAEDVVLSSANSSVIRFPIKPSKAVSECCAEISIKDGSTVLKSTCGPDAKVFVQRKDGTKIDLNDNDQVELGTGDSFSLLPDEFMYEVSVAENTCDNDAVKPSQNSDETDPTTSDKQGKLQESPVSNGFSKKEQGDPDDEEDWEKISLSEVKDIPPEVHETEQMKNAETALSVEKASGASQHGSSVETRDVPKDEVLQANETKTSENKQQSLAVAEAEPAATAQDTVNEKKEHSEKGDKSEKKQDDKTSEAEKEKSESEEKESKKSLAPAKRGARGRAAKSRGASQTASYARDRSRRATAGQVNYRYDDYMVDSDFDNVSSEEEAPRKRRRSSKRQDSEEDWSGASADSDDEWGKKKGKSGGGEKKGGGGGRKRKTHGSDESDDEPEYVARPTKRRASPQKPPAIERPRRGVTSPKKAPAKKQENSGSEEVSEEEPETSKSTKAVISTKKPVAVDSGRRSCAFGAKCYRKNNAQHKAKFTHPGDSDYVDPNEQQAEAGPLNLSGDEDGMDDSKDSELPKIYKQVIAGTNQLKSDAAAAYKTERQVPQQGDEDLESGTPSEGADSGSDYNEGKRKKATQKKSPAKRGRPRGRGRGRARAH